MKHDSIIDRVTRAIGAHRLCWCNEDELQRGIAQVLSQEGLSFKREHRITGEDRIDFMLEDGAGIEVKIDGPLSALTKQLQRYAKHSSVRALLVVTPLARLSRLPDQLAGKPIRVLYLEGSVL